MENMFILPVLIKLGHAQPVIGRAWLWVMLANNTMLTAAIIGKILCAPLLPARVPLRIANVAMGSYVRFQTRRSDSFPARGSKYAVLLEAFIESSIISWGGIILYGVYNETIAPVCPHTPSLPR